MIYGSVCGSVISIATFGTEVTISENPDIILHAKLCMLATRHLFDDLRLTCLRSLQPGSPEWRDITGKDIACSGSIGFCLSRDRTN